MTKQGGQSMKCKKCKSKAILASAAITSFESDREPYESGKVEDCGYKEIWVDAVMVTIYWCPKCCEVIKSWTG